MFDHFEAFGGDVFFGGVDEEGGFFDEYLVEVEGDAVYIFDEFGPDFGSVEGGYSFGDHGDDLLILEHDLDVGLEEFFEGGLLLSMDLVSFLLQVPQLNVHLLS